MNQLQIVIGKDGYAIHSVAQQRRLVSNIRRIDDALEIYRDLTGSSIHPPKRPSHPTGEWPIVPGALEGDDLR